MEFKSTILCIFEGEVREPKYFKTIQKHYFNDTSILLCSYGNDIYELFKDIEGDPELDIIEILRDSKGVSKNKDLLTGYSSDDFNQVFLFFDLEYQDEQFNINNLSRMISAFNEETENGKLFVSYPMIEAIRDISSFESYIDHKVNLENCSGKIYKKLSAKGLKQYQDPRKITKNEWDKLIEINVLKANFIINNNREDVLSQPEQDVILSEQSKLIQYSRCLYVLSSFPLFVFHQKSSQLDFCKQ